MIGKVVLSAVATIALLSALPGDSQADGVDGKQSSQSFEFKLRRETKLAAIRVAIKERIASGPRHEAKVLRKFLADPDRMEVVLAHVEALEATTEDGIALQASETPVQDFLKFIIDNWDSIKQIIEFIVDLFGDTPITLNEAPKLDEPFVCFLAQAA